MTDDIVTRLRARAEHRSPINQSLVMHIRQPIMNEAADEIERLRAENDGLRIRILTLSKKLDQVVNNGAQ